MSLFKRVAIQASFPVYLTAILALLIITPGTVQAYDGPIYSPLPLTMPKLGMNKNLYVRQTKITISRDLVTYDLKVENYGGSVETSTLYLPLPLIGDHWDTANSRPELFGDHPLGVRIFADGEEISPKLQLRALYHQLDISDLVKAAGLPLHPVSERTLLRFKGAPIEAVEALRDKGMIPSRWNRWDVEATYYWQQIFAAKSFTRIRIELIPAYGELVDSLMKIGKEIGLGIDSYDRKQLCLSKDDEERALVPFGTNEYVPNRIFVLPVFMRSIAHWGTANGSWEIEVKLSERDAMVGICGVDHFEKTETGSYRFGKRDVTYNTRLIMDPPPDFQIYWLAFE